jgi:hypothetical protein
VGDGREDGDTVGFLEPPGRLDATTPRLDLSYRDIDFDGSSHVFLKIT